MLDYSYIQAAEEASGQSYDLSRRYSISSLVFALNILVSVFPFIHMIVLSPKKKRWSTFSSILKKKAKDEIDEKEDEEVDRVDALAASEEEMLHRKLDDTILSTDPAAGETSLPGTNETLGQDQVQLTESGASGAAAGVFPPSSNDSEQKQYMSAFARAAVSAPSKPGSVAQAEDISHAGAQKTRTSRPSARERASAEPKTSTFWDMFKKEAAEEASDFADKAEDKMIEHAEDLKEKEEERLGEYVNDRLEPHLDDPSLSSDPAASEPTLPSASENVGLNLVQLTVSGAQATADVVLPSQPSSKDSAKKYTSAEARAAAVSTKPESATEDIVHYKFPVREAPAAERPISFVLPAGAAAELTTNFGAPQSSVSTPGVPEAAEQQLRAVDAAMVYFHPTPQSLGTGAAGDVNSTQSHAAGASAEETGHARAFA